jgi:hypothetical protein
MIRSTVVTRDEDLRRWIRAGLLDASTGERILAFEAERSAERAARSERPGFIEVLVYLSAAITAAGTTVLAATNWDNLASLSRIAIPGVAAAAVLFAGDRLRRSRNDAFTRGASLAWLLGGALVVATVTIAASESGGSEETVALASGLSALATSVALWAPMRMHPQIAGIGAALFLLSTAISVRAPADWSVAVLGASWAWSGLVVLLATEFGILAPTFSARLLAGLGLAFGSFNAGLKPSPPIAELLAPAAVVILLTAGIRLQSLAYIAFGVLVAFAGLLTLILRHVQSPTLAGLALIAIGLLLLLAIAAIRNSLPWARFGIDASGRNESTPVREFDAPSDAGEQLP